MDIAIFIEQLVQQAHSRIAHSEVRRPAGHEASENDSVWEFNWLMRRADDAAQGLRNPGRKLYLEFVEWVQEPIEREYASPADRLEAYRQFHHSLHTALEQMGLLMDDLPDS